MHRNPEISIPTVFFSSPRFHQKYISLCNRTLPVNTVDELIIILFNSYLFLLLFNTILYVWLCLCTIIPTSKSRDITLCPQSVLKKLTIDQRIGNTPRYSININNYTSKTYGKSTRMCTVRYYFSDSGECRNAAVRTKHIDNGNLKHSRSTVASGFSGRKKKNVREFVISTVRTISNTVNK